MSPASQNTSAPVPPAPRYGPVDAFQAPRYRLGRLEELLGMSLKQPADIAALYLALVTGQRLPD